MIQELGVSLRDFAPSASRPDFTHHASGTVLSPVERPALSPVEGRGVNGNRATAAIVIFHE
jgi:hypothetical protein